MTRSGRGLALTTVLTLFTAASSGNNLLYLLYSAGLAALIVSWILGRLNLSSIETEAQAPEQIFRETEFPLMLRLRRRIWPPSSWLRLSWGNSKQSIDRLIPEKTAAAAVRLRPRWRGINRIEGLHLESFFPFGLFLHRKSLAVPSLTAYPKLREIRSPQEISAATETGGEIVLRKGGGDEFFGVREYTEADDVRWINWKLTAKQGRPLITEFASPAGEKVTVSLDSVGMGAEAEFRIKEAASACRYFIDSGAEVRLVTPEGDEGYGKGLLHLDRLLRALALLGEGKSPRACPPPAGASERPPGDPVLLRRVTWAGAVLIFASMFLIDDIQTWALAVLGLALPISLWLQERDGPWLPKPIWDLSSVAVLAYICLLDWRFSGIILTNTHLVLYLIINRLLNPLKGESPGQTLVILFLAFFLISGQTISLWYFLSFILFTAFAVLWLVFSLGAKPELWRSWAPGLAASWLAILALGALCFIVTPRFDTWYQKNPLAAVAGLDKLRAQAGAVSGFTENVSLGTFGRLKTSAARVMRIKPPAGTRPAPALYVRGAAFDFFDGKRWLKTPLDFRFLQSRGWSSSSRGHGWLVRQNGKILILPASFKTSAINPLLSRHPGESRGLDDQTSDFLDSGLRRNDDMGKSSSSGAVKYDFMVFPLNTAVVFTVSAPQAIEGIEGTAGFDATDSIYLSSPYFNGIRYRLSIGEASQGLGGMIKDYPRVVHQLFLQIPKDMDPRAAELARRITADARDDRARAQAIEAYLRKNYRYSNFSKDLRADLNQFLFSGKSGNCEYFASAGVILLRLSGIPSRLAAGFLVENWNEFGQFYDVRQNEAHAWAEAYVGGQWIRVDPTPSEAFSLGNGLAERLSRVFNAAQAKWYERVIGYDAYVQRNSFYRLGMGSVRQVVEKIVRWLLYAAFALIAIFAGVGLARWLSRQLRAQSGPYFKAQAALERRGFKREPCQTPKEYAGKVVAARPQLAGFQELVEWHYRERYGKRELTPADRERLDRILLEILRSL